jgi:hypothetical protein
MKEATIDIDGHKVNVSKVGDEISAKFEIDGIWKGVSMREGRDSGFSAARTGDNVTLYDFPNEAEQEILRRAIEQYLAE